jgi:hypothetical protein
MSLQFGFVILWQKAFGAKAALKMLVKLTPGGKLRVLVCHPTKKKQSLGTDLSLYEHWVYLHCQDLPLQLLFK